MKRFIITFLAIVFAQTFCYAVGDNQIDTIKVEYQTYNNDTVYYKKYFSSDDVYTFCSLKQYEGDLFLKHHALYNKMNLPDLIDQFNNDNDNRVAFIKYVIRTFLRGYGKERCTEMVKKKVSQISIYICVDVQGNIVDLSFNYDYTFAKFMTPEDIIRSTRILQGCAPIPFFAEYINMGVKILPPLTIEIFKSSIEEYLNEE